MAFPAAVEEAEEGVGVVRGKNPGKIWTVVGILIFIAVIYFVSKHTAFISHLIYKSGALAPIVALLLYPALAPTPITTDPITVIVSVIYGPLIGAFIAIFGNTMSAVVEYYVGYKIGQATNFDKSKKNLPFNLGKLPADSPVFLIFGRMVPGYGSKIISIIAGAYKVHMRRYIWTSLVTTILGAFILAYGSFGLVKFIKFSLILKFLHL